MMIDMMDVLESAKQKSNKKHLHATEYYDEHLSEILPDHFHHGDVVSSDRMLAYADAIMATCATFLVIPIRNLSHMKNGQTFFEFTYDIRTEIAMFFLGFTVVLAIWENINVRAMVVKRVDDFVLTLVIFELLATTALPFSLALQGHYPSEKTSTILTFCVLGFVQIIDMMVIGYSMATPRILHIEMQKWSRCELRQFRNIFIIKPVVSLALVLIGGAFCYVHFAVSWGFIAVLALMPTIRKLYLYIRRRINKNSKMENYQFYFFFSKGSISKERVEIMSDATIAIITCILILDITVENFPPKANVQKYGLNSVLDHMKPEFYSFLATFAIISTLWYINYTVLHLFRTVTAIMLYLQKIFLAFACLCPLLGTTILRFSTKKNVESKESIRVAAIVVFCSSTANFFILFYGFFTKKKYLNPWAVGDFKTNKRHYFYSLFKALNVPFWSIFCALGTLGSPNISLYFLYISFLACPVSFFIAKLVLMNHLGKGIHPQYIEFEAYNIEKKKKNRVDDLGNKQVRSEITDSMDDIKI